MPDGHDGHDDDAALAARLRQLSDRLDERKPAEPRRDYQEPAGAYSLIGRLVSDLVAGTLVGGAIGQVLDYLFGTGVVFLVVLLMFGFAAGVWMMVRSSQRSQTHSNDTTANGPAANGLTGDEAARD